MLLQLIVKTRFELLPEKIWKDETKTATTYLLRKKHKNHTTSLPAICYFTCNVKRFFQVYGVWYFLQRKPYIAITRSLRRCKSVYSQMLDSEVEVFITQVFIYCNKVGIEKYEERRWAFCDFDFCPEHSSAPSTTDGHLLNRFNNQLDRDDLYY